MANRDAAELRRCWLFTLAPVPVRPVAAILASTLLASTLLASTLLVPAASGQAIPGKACGPEVAEGTTFHFEEETSAQLPAGVCFVTAFHCDQPEEDGGPTYQLLDAGCDPTAGPCRVQVRVPLKFPGNQDNIHDGPLHVEEVRWYVLSAAPSCEDSVQCGQVSTCGKEGTGTATINTERAVFTATRSLSCADVQHTDQPLSLTAWACVTTSGCKQRLDINGLDLDGPDVAAQIGCPDPPKQNCGAGDASSCQVCTPAGVGPGFGLPGYGGPGDWATGPNATLRYSSKGAGHPGYPGTPSWNVALGRYWSHDYAERIVATGSPNPEDHAWIITKYGTFREWRDLDPGTGVYATVSPSDEYRTLTWTGSGWTLTDLDGTVEEFDAAGLWRSTTDRNLNQKIATYTAGQLTSVALPDGRREDFTYYPAGDPAEGKLASITEYGTDGVTHLPAWDYRWTGDDLTEIDRPDGTALLFEYDGTTGYLAKVRLRERNGTATRVLRAWSYTPDGKVSETWKGGDTPAAGTEDWKLSYDSSTQTTVTDPLGKPIVYTYELDPASPNVRVTQISGDCPVCGLAPNVQLGYSDPANPLRPTATTDGRGITTAMSYDTHGQVTSRTEAMGEPEARTTEWAYDPAFPALATSMDQPSVAGGASLRTTDWTRDGSGNPTDRTISGSEAGSAFTLTTASSFNAAGLPLTIDPPGYTTTDQTSFTYDATGLIPMTRTDPLVGTTTFGHDAFNRRTSVTDPNGLETTTAYDELDRVTEVRQLGPATPTDDLVTAYEYTSLGDLFRTTLPAGNVVEYAYDPAGRLTSIERRPDATTHGERVVYTLDAAGNRTREERQRWDAGSSTWVPVSATAYDYQNRCQVDQIRQAPGTPEEATTAFEYDCDGNLTSIWDPNHDRATDPPTTSYAYDALNRLTTVTQAWTPAGGTPGTAVTTYSYDVQDHLTGVTDAEGNPTTYVDSDRDLLTQEDSLVSGTTTHHYNEHGEEDRSTDARGIVVARTIDALDRVTNVDYPDDTLDTTYLYDTAPGSCAAPGSPLGRLASITRNGETLDFCYDHFGRMVKDGELGYAYDMNGNRTGIVYPGGVSAAYGFDFADRETSLSVTSPAGGRHAHRRRHRRRLPALGAALEPRSRQRHHRDPGLRRPLRPHRDHPLGPRHRRPRPHLDLHDRSGGQRHRNRRDRGLLRRRLDSDPREPDRHDGGDLHLLCGPPGGQQLRRREPGPRHLPGPGQGHLVERLLRWLGRLLRRRLGVAADLLRPDVRLPGAAVLLDLGHPRPHRRLLGHPRLDLRQDREPAQRRSRRWPGRGHVPVHRQRQRRRYAAPRPGEPRGRWHARLRLGCRRQPRPGGPRREPRRLHLRRREPLVYRRSPGLGSERRLPLRRPRLPPERHPDRRRQRLRHPPLRLRRPPPRPPPPAQPHGPGRHDLPLLPRRPPRRPARNRRHRHRDLDLPDHRPPRNAPHGHRPDRGDHLGRRLRTLRHRLPAGHDGRSE